jgi:4-diphosphocytidyl-2-C-methyl-D-erythritol kinase
LVRAPLVDYAPAKVNLTLRVIGRRADGFHDIESLVVFAHPRDRLTLVPGGELALAVSGPTGPASGPADDNLVLKAARALATRIAGLRLGRFTLTKRLPVAAGLGGGSADAAAALRLLARANALADADPRVIAAAAATGADVPVCLDPRPRLMRGKGDELSPALPLPQLPAILVNPGVAIATKDVFAAFAASASKVASPRSTAMHDIPREREALLAFLASQPNDLENTAIALAPVIADVLAALRALPGCRLARMSGSGASCFALFERERAASAARILKAAHPHWWVRATVLGSP